MILLEVSKLILCVLFCSNFSKKLCFDTNTLYPQAMRAPGGEDHCSCIALMRLSSESESLCSSMWKFYTDPICETSLHEKPVPLVFDLCFLHDKLRQIECSRGYGVFHGSGVLPKTRRILLNVTCQICLSATKSSEVNHIFVHQAVRELVRPSLTDLSVKSSASDKGAGYFLSAL